MFKIISKSEDSTLRLAEKLGASLFPGAIILLTGELGAGKTVFVRGLAKGLKYEGLVKSPSYNIMNIYESGTPLIHFDLYRIADAQEFYAIGAYEYLRGDNVCAVEWPEHAENAWGGDYLEVAINDIGGDTREIVLSAKGEQTRKWLLRLKDDINC